MTLMEGPVTTRGALLQVLRDGPGYGRELIRRVERMTTGRLRLSEARVYPLLKALEKAGLVRATRVAPKGRRGARSRTYYDLTIRGVELSGAERAVLSALVTRQASGHRPEKPDLATMAQRVLEAEELSESGESIRGALLRTRGRRA